MKINSLPISVKIFWIPLILILLGSCSFNKTPNIVKLNNLLVKNHSSGCGIVQTGTGNFIQFELLILDHERTYHMMIPSNYDANYAYPLVFRWHGSGGNGLSGGLGIESYSKDKAIIVGADGLDQSWDENTASEDLMFFDRMLETIETQYCIDRNRVFSYGFSRGGYFTNLLSCRRGDIIRASATIAGGPEGKDCKGKVARWFLHDKDDDSVPFLQGMTERDQALFMNGCSNKTFNSGDYCVQYQDCEMAPVVWCQTKGYGHNIRSDYAPSRVWNFFQDLP